MTQEELLKQIKDEAAQKGLHIAEEAIIQLLDVLESVISKYVQESENKFDDLALPFLPMVFGLLKAQADKIDGKVAEKKD